MAKQKAETPEKSSFEQWTDGLKAEFRKIVWPDQKTIIKQTGAVIGVSVVLGIMISILDFIFQHGVDFLVNFKL